MGVLENIIRELDETYVIGHVTGRHDDARIQFSLNSNTVSDDAGFDTLIAEYYNHHYTKCVSGGGKLSRAEAGGKAKNILENDYRNRGMDKLNAYQDGKTGSNGGMRKILDILMERLKSEALEFHIRDVLDRYVAPTSFEEQTSIIRELIQKMPLSSAQIDTQHPERYAKNYEELIRVLADSLKSQYASFRRL
jgi:hypothetical protein